MAKTITLIAQTEATTSVDSEGNTVNHLPTFKYVVKESHIAEVQRNVEALYPKPIKILQADGTISEIEELVRETRLQTVFEEREVVIATTTVGAETEAEARAIVESTYA